MPPRPKPSHLRVIEGNKSKRPILPDKIDPPKPSRPLPPPAHLGKHAKAEWKRISLQLHRLGILTEVDRAAFEAYCVSYGVYRDADDRLRELAKVDRTGGGAMVVTTKAGNAIHNPVFSIRQKAIADMVKYATEFGFTPSSRTQVYSPPPGETGKKGKKSENGQVRDPSSFFED